MTNRAILSIMGFKRCKHTTMISVTVLPMIVAWIILTATAYCNRKFVKYCMGPNPHGAGKVIYIQWTDSSGSNESFVDNFQLISKFERFRVQ